MKSVNKRPIPRKTALAVSGGVLLALALTMASQVSATASRTNYLTFSKAVALPGATLPAGSYTFQVMNPLTSTNAVQVTSRDGSKLHFVGLTRPASRPAGLPADQAVSLGEGRVGEPVPIKAWFPIGLSSGHEFIYR